jgi:UDP-GlcNAc:undecaprenyl-phosphate GlcNAc-1-phosphate transferase
VSIPEDIVEPPLLVIALLIAASTSALLTPLVARVARRYGFVDRPAERKVNKRGDIPVLGGLAVAGGCAAGLVSFVVLFPDYTFETTRLMGFIVGSLILMVAGILDDRIELDAWHKFPVQIFAAGVAIYCGFGIQYFTNPFTSVTTELSPWLMWPLSLVWIVAVTNAMNLIDGLDGLSTGLGAIISATLIVICWQADQMTGVVIGIALLGGLLGFLPFNFPPARIFLGDTGALFIGYALALLSVQGYRKAALLTFVVPLLALAVPLLDTALSVVRRIRLGRGIFSADRMHMHHRLLAREGSQRRAVLWLYFQTVCFSIIAVAFAQLKGYSAFIFLAAVVILTARLLRNLGLFSVEPESLHGVDIQAAAEGEES